METIIEIYTWLKSREQLQMGHSAAAGKFPMHSLYLRLRDLSEEEVERLQEPEAEAICWKVVSLAYKREVMPGEISGIGLFKQDLHKGNAS